MKQFKKVYIEISNICNLKCSFCPTTKREPKSLNSSEFEHILKEIKPYTNHIYLHVKGEPLFHKNLKDFLEISKANNFFVNITTNGTLIEKYNDIFISDLAPRQINFSLHSFDGKLESIDNKNYLMNILNFTKNSLEKCHTYISLRLWNFNQNDKDSIQQKGNRYILNTIENFFNLDYKIADILTPGKGLKIKDKLFINSDLEFKWPDLNDDFENEDGFCYGLRNQIAILSNGTVVPCCLDGEGVINLGNIFKESFNDILNSKRVNNIYNGFSNHKAVEIFCKKCQFKNKF
ncbi:SPASM domain-containing protein [uncultured Cetobacterium sp.]|uniref:radical SAM/SPASM domain-containing protein n=1 Tax=uncultured Cetobacterium sp. TaxID=527638 RepID=UPI002605C3DE|nr:SPASM domain-containing protein [uncultured Cetobacterium sp.]